MKKSFLTLAVAVTMLVTAGQAIEVLETQGQEVEAKTAQEAWNADITNNVGNGQQYAYSITHVDGDKIYGIPLNKKSYSNQGIFLYEEEVGFTLDEGDDIIVVWGEEEDEFEVIAKAVQATDGTYVMDSSHQ